MSGCPICLELVTGEAYPDPCFHKFCYHCILQWSEMLASRGARIECPLCKTHFESIVHDFNGTKFQRHHLLDPQVNEKKRAWDSSAHARRLAVYQTTSASSGARVSPAAHGDNSKWHFCWLQRELQALMQDDDVDIVVHNVLGTIETLRKRHGENHLKRGIPSASQLARKNQLDSASISAVLEPFVDKLSSRVAEELLSFMASGLNISTYDELWEQSQASELEAEPSHI